MLLLAVGAAHAADVPVRSEQRLHLSSRSVTLMAEVGTVPVASAPGRTDASAGYISYMLKDAPTAVRPVLFIFNGGPGAASALLHMGAFGPERVRVPQDPAAPLPAGLDMQPNHDPLFDQADLVFVDPPGTGFSRLEPDADLSVYNSVTGDAAVNAQLVRTWLADHGRLGAPVFLLGESYGTIRAAAMVEALAKLDPAIKLHGVLLLGQALNMIETSQRPDNVISYVVSLPTLAAIACYHGKAAKPCSAERSIAEAEHFARTDYLSALVQGHSLDPSEKQRVALRLADISGISSDYYLTHDLRISKEQFRVELLRTEGRVLSRYDARYTAPRPADAGETVGPDAFNPVSALYGKAVTAYLRSTLKVPRADDYQVMVRPEGEWDYGGAPSPFTDWPFMSIIEKAMTENPALRLFVGTGVYDLTTTIGAADYLRAQSSAPADRMVFARYPAGHVAYSDEASWGQLVADVRRFLAEDRQ